MYVRYGIYLESLHGLYTTTKQEYIVTLRYLQAGAWRVPPLQALARSSPAAGSRLDAGSWMIRVISTAGIVLLVA
jgi:hypothetical protein